MNSSKGATIASVNSLKQSLSKELVKVEKFQNDSNGLSSSFYERCVDMLDQLDKLPVDVPVLSTTLIGTVVTKYKKCNNEHVSSKAKDLVKKWKNLAKKDGVITSKPLSPKPPKVQRRVSDTQTTPFQRRPSDTQTTPFQRRVSHTQTNPSSTVPIPPEWKSLPLLRRNVCAKFLDVLTVSGSVSIEKSTVVPICTELEEAIVACSKNDNTAYKEKARSICFNLKRNASLRENILNSSIKPKSLMSMTAEELATEEKKAVREKLEKDLQDSRRLDWEQANEDKINEMCGIKGELLQASLFTCGRCKSTKTTSTQKQTRSADEPMTVFVFCINCGNRWKC